MSTQVSIPGYTAGTWVIDPAASAVSFQTKMLGFMTARGTFDDFEGKIVLAESPLESTVKAVVRTTSVNTRNARRDRDLRQEGYLSVEKYPTMTFASTAVRADGDSFAVEGDFTVLALTKRITLRLTPQGFDSTGGRDVVRFRATTEVSNKEAGVTKGAAFIGDRTQVTLDIVATKQN
jgi:polyisoprenoid-binding protein YceI